MSVDMGYAHAQVLKIKEEMDAQAARVYQHMGLEALTAAYIAGYRRCEVDNKLAPPPPESAITAVVEIDEDVAEIEEDAAE